MKKVLFFTSLVLSLYLKVTGQNFLISDDSSYVSSSSNALLEVHSANGNKGILIPRLTTAQRTAIATTVADSGLVVYDTDIGTFWYWDGGQWVEIGVDSRYWKLTGNAGTASGTHFLGTTDNQDLDIRTNNIIHVRISTKGQIEVLNTGYSVFIGEQAGEHDNSLSNQNVFIGYQSGYSNTAGYYNTAIGGESFYTNTTGSYNTAIGKGVLHFNSTGYGNTVVGSNALYNNTTGGYNTAAGFNSLYSNTTGSYNTAMGRQTLYYNTTGYSNIAIGVKALYRNTNRTHLVAIGDSALYNNGYGATQSYHSVQNVAVGSKALYANTIGGGNTAIGYRTLFNNTSGFGNTAIGDRSLYYNTTGTGNTAVGFASLMVNDDGHGNTAIGEGALPSNISGDYNTAVGQDAYQDNSGLVFSNSTALGYNTSISWSNQVHLGNSSITEIAGQVNFSTYSDARIKEDITEDVKGLDFILKLRPVTYHFNLDKENELLGIVDSSDYKEKYDIEKIKFSGFIAQEVEQAARACGYDFSGVRKPHSEHDLYGLSYAEFVVPLVKAVQEQQEMIEALKRKNKEQEKMIRQQQQQIHEILMRLKHLEE